MDISDNGFSVIKKKKVTKDKYGDVMEESYNIPLLGASFETLPSEKFDVIYSFNEWQEKGFTKSESKLLSMLNYHTFTPNSKLRDETPTKALDAMVTRINKKLKGIYPHIKIAANKSEARPDKLGRKLKNTAPTP